jgi:hypothetical protein
MPEKEQAEPRAATAPRNGNGNGTGLAGLPAWARAAAIVGIPGTIAMFLVWMGASEVPKISSRVEANQAALTAVIETQRQQDRRTEDIVRLLQRLCSNTARTPDDRTRCFDR